MVALELEAHISKHPHYENLLPAEGDDGNFVAVLPTNPPNLTVDFRLTTFYHWPQMSENITEGGVDLFDPDNFTSVNGAYVLFKNGDKLNTSQCLVDEDFYVSTKDSAECIISPEFCENGLSFSLFYFAEYTELPELLLDKTKYDTWPKEYIISTGGEDGAPGIALYRRGPFLGAVVSTGNLTWTVEVLGAAPLAGRWTNIGVRWKMPLVSTPEEYAEALAQGKKETDLGGLHIFLNAGKIDEDQEEPLVQGSVIFPQIWGCQFNPDDASYDCESPLPAVKDPFDPPKMMQGCHMTKDNPVPRNFGGGRYDELAIFDHFVENDELPIFLGGYKETLTELDTDELIRLMLYVDVSAVEQAATVIEVVGSIVDGDDTQSSTPFENRYPEEETTTVASAANSGEGANGNGTTTTTTAKPPEKTTKDLLNLLDVTEKLTDTAKLKELISTQEFDVRLGVAPAVGEILSVKGRYTEDWSELGVDPDHRGAHFYNQRLVDYLTYVTEHRTPLEEWDKGIVDKVVSSKNFASWILKKPAALYRQMGQGEEGYIKAFPWETKTWKNAYKAWGYSQPPADSVSVASLLFTGDCETKDVTLVATISDMFPDNGRKNPTYIRTNELALDSRVVTIQVTANKLDREQKPLPGYGERCEADPKMLVRRPLLFTLAVLSYRHDFGRKLNGFFDELDNSKVKRRHCAVWNPEIGLNGGWDTEGVKTIYVSDTKANCAATKLGTFGIVAEIEDDPARDDDFDWLTIFKWIGYILSIICLLIFIGTIVYSTYLWEMFHGLGLHLATCMLLGHVAILVTELDSIRDDRVSCATFGCLLNFFYVATAALLAAESFASFRAIILGEIGGRTVSYLCLAYGVALVALGYNICVNLEHMGDDPHCMIGWENAAKWAFFIPMCCLAGMALLFTLVATCNVCTPAFRKESIVAEYGSVATGLFMLTVLFAVQWAFAPLAYIRFSNVDMPDFYPAFQVMNSVMGILVFVFLGLGSRRFRRVITGKVNERHYNTYMVENEMRHDESVDDYNDHQMAGGDTITETIDHEDERNEEKEKQEEEESQPEPGPDGEPRPGSGTSQGSGEKKSRPTSSTSKGAPAEDEVPTEEGLPNAAFIPSDDAS